jgi:hypothetical protein
LVRQGGDDDEIADWLAAESELRQLGDAGRAAERRDDGRDHQGETVRIVAGASSGRRPATP